MKEKNEENIFTAVWKKNDTQAVNSACKSIRCSYYKQIQSLQIKPDCRRWKTAMWGNKYSGFRTYSRLKKKVWGKEINTKKPFISLENNIYICTIFLLKNVKTSFFSWRLF